MGGRAYSAGVVALALAGGSASAGVLLQADFDATGPDVGYGYAYAQTGTPSETHGEVPAGGAAGTAGYQINANLTGAGGFFGGFGGGFIENAPATVTTPLAPADILYSFNFMADGLTGTTTSVRAEFQFRAPDDTLQPADAGTTADLIARIDLTFPYAGPAGTYQPYAGSLAAGAFADGTTLANFQQFGGQINNFQLNFNIDGAYADFGQDANNIIGFDNLLVSQGPVPEPATLGVFGIAAIGLLARRQRTA